MIKSYKTFINESKITEENASELMNLIYNYFYETFLESEVNVEYEDIPEDSEEDMFLNADDARIESIQVSSDKTDYRYEVLCFYNDTARFKQYPTKVTLTCHRLTVANYFENAEQESKITDYQKFLADMDEYENHIFNSVIKDGTDMIIYNLDAEDDIDVFESGFTKKELEGVIENLLKHLDTIDVTKKNIVNIYQFLKDNNGEVFLRELLKNKQIYNYYKNIFKKDPNQYFELERYLSPEMKAEFNYLTRGKKGGLLDLKTKE